MGQKQYYTVNLKPRERKELSNKIKKGKGSASEIRRAHILLKADRSQKKKWLDREIAEALDVTLATVQAVRKKFCQRGLQVIKHPKVSGRPKIVDGDVEANIIATALSEPPKGRVRWTLRLIAGRLVELHIVPQISHHSVWRVLKKKEVKHWLTKKWRIPPKENGEFVYRMEDILEVYKRPYEPKRPLLSFDESNKQQIQDIVEPLPMKEGKVQRFESTYKRNGTRNLFMFFEPLAGKRRVKVTKRRTKKDFAICMKEIVDEMYPDAEKIVLVMDNLDSHHLGSLYENFRPKEAKRITDKLEIHYTPKRGSWLNIAECELSVLSRQCLKRRIGDSKRLNAEVQAWVKIRNRESVKCDWQFTIEDARIKLKSLYPKLSKIYK